VARYLCIDRIHEFRSPKTRRLNVLLAGCRVTAFRPFAVARGVGQS
jgi:hypothetical protein